MTTSTSAFSKLKTMLREGALGGGVGGGGRRGRGERRDGRRRDRLGAHLHAGGRGSGGACGLRSAPCPRRSAGPERTDDQQQPRDGSEASHCLARAGGA